MTTIVHSGEHHADIVITHIAEAIDNPRQRVFKFVEIFSRESIEERSSIIFGLVCETIRGGVASDQARG